jgi:glyoxylase-like metal-dependent hydrolase (beta-lactamase superfamily II)
VEVLERSDGTLLALFPDKWRLGAVERLHPELRLEPLEDRTLILPGHGPDTTVGRERATNPFLRWDAREIQVAVERQTGFLPKNPVEVFATVRLWKDNFS